MIAALFMPSSLTLATYSLILFDPSRRLYSVCTCKCVKLIVFSSIFQRHVPLSPRSSAPGCPARLVRWLFMPAARHPSLLSSEDCAVIGMIGTCFASESSMVRICRAASRPPITGIIRSIKITSNFCGFAAYFSTASRPFHASSTVAP